MSVFLRTNSLFCWYTLSTQKMDFPHTFWVWLCHFPTSTDNLVQPLKFTIGCLRFDEAVTSFTCFSGSRTFQQLFPLHVSLLVMIHTFTFWGVSFYNGLLGARRGIRSYVQCITAFPFALRPFQKATVHLLSLISGFLPFTLAILMLVDSP